MRKALRSAFTLIEMLVVIVIIAVLVGLLMPTLRDARRQARTARCKYNLRQLHLAAMNYMVQSGDEGRTPHAASSEHWDEQDQEWHQDHKGWVDWFKYTPTATSPTIPAPYQVPADGEKVTYWWGDQAITCIKKGTLYPFIKDPRIYLCPEFSWFVKNASLAVIPANVANYRDARRSYAMNSDASHISFVSGMGGDNARKIMFADMAYVKYTEATWAMNGHYNSNDTSPTSRKWFRSRDAELTRNQERIGNYHRGKGAVIFVDGHTEMLNHTNGYEACIGNWGQ